MEPEHSNIEEAQVEVEQEESVLNKITPFSKYLAMILFIAMPFVGGWIGYNYAPEKLVEVDRVVIREVTNQQQEVINKQNKVIDGSVASGWNKYIDEVSGYGVDYPVSHALHKGAIDTSGAYESCVGSPIHIGIKSDTIFTIATDDPDDICVSGHYTGLLSGKRVLESETLNINGLIVFKRTYEDDLPEPEIIEELVGEYDSDSYKTYQFSSYRFEKDGSFFTVSMHTTNPEDRIEMENDYERLINSFYFLD
jgi:hypothetical protein